MGIVCEANCCLQFFSSLHSVHMEATRNIISASTKHFSPSKDIQKLCFARGDSTVSSTQTWCPLVAFGITQYNLLAFRRRLVVFG